MEKQGGNLRQSQVKSKSARNATMESTKFDRMGGSNFKTFFVVYGAVDFGVAECWIIRAAVMTITF